jgi:hypothetical protein
LGISLDGVEFQPMPSSNELQQQAAQPPTNTGKLTIAEAKKALAEAFGVKPEAIEITIRG